MNYGRIGTLWSPASALVRFCAYGAAGIMILGVMAVVPRQRRVWTCLGERSLQIYILHRPIRDLMEAAGFYRAVTSRSRMTVVFVMAFSVALAVCLSAPRITKLFRYHLRDVCGNDSYGGSAYDGFRTGCGVSQPVIRPAADGQSRTGSFRLPAGLQYRLPSWHGLQPLLLIR